MALSAKVRGAYRSLQRRVFGPSEDMYAGGGLHHRAAMRQAIGTLPLFVCTAALVVRDILALSGYNTAIVRSTLHAHLVQLLCVCAVEVYIFLTLRKGGPMSTMHVAYCASLFYVLPKSVSFSPLRTCTVAGPAACTDRAYRRLLTPLGAPFYLISGLPPRFAMSLEAIRLFACTLVIYATTAALPPAWVAQVVVQWLLSTVLLRAVLGADEPRELVQLRLCPSFLLPLRDSLMAAGARVARISELRVPLLIVLAAELAQFCASFAFSLYSGGVADVRLRIATLVAWALSFAAALVHVARLHVRRAARHGRAPPDRYVHDLHVRLSTLDGGIDAEGRLATAAAELLSAFVPGCSIALAEWTLGPTRACADVLEDGGYSPIAHALSLRRAVARSPRPEAGRAMLGAVRRGCGRLGSATAALSKPGSCAGMTLDSEDFEEGSSAFPDWAALMDPRGAGPGTVSLSLMGTGAEIAGAMWVHTPASLSAPSPLALREYAECVGAMLLRNRAHRAALKGAASAARADAENTLALQRAFLSGVTHELRTPLNAVVGFTATVLEGAALSAVDAEYLRCSMTAANTLLTIIDQLLDYAKWGQERQEVNAALHLTTLSAAPLRISVALDELVDVTGGRSVSSGVRLMVEVDAAVQAARLRGDAARLRQVLVNLVDNALKFTPRGGSVKVLVEVPNLESSPTVGSPAEAAMLLHTSRFGSDSSSDDMTENEALDFEAAPLWVRITVTDTGIGVPAADQWRLFRPFSQVLQTNTEGGKSAGTGLGLVISRAIIREMGGDVSFVSREGEGTSFTILVPFQKDDAAAASDASLIAEEARSLAGVTVMCALADAAQAGVLSRMAASWGATVVDCAVPDGPSDVLSAVAWHASSSNKSLLIIGDAAAMGALCGDAAPPLPPHTSVLLAAPLAEQANLPALRNPVLPLLLPASPSRLRTRLVEAATADAQASVAEAVPTQLKEPEPSTLRVLLAEDNPMNAAVARAVLTRCGVATPLIVGDGELAVDAFTQAAQSIVPQWSVILLDMLMPKMDGVAAARAIRSLEAAAVADGSPPRPPVRIVAITAYASDEDRKACLAAGMDEFMVKPITPTAMRAMLSRVTPVPIAE